MARTKSQFAESWEEASAPQDSQQAMQTHKVRKSRGVQTNRGLSVKNRLDEVKFRCFPVKRTLRRQECSPRRSGGERTVYLSCSTKRFPPSCCFASRRQRSEEHTSELQSRLHLVCRLLLEKKK